MRGAALLAIALIATACAQKHWVDEKTREPKDAKRILALCRTNYERDIKRDETLIHPGPPVGARSPAPRNPTRLRWRFKGEVFSDPVKYCMRKNGYIEVRNR